MRKIFLSQIFILGIIFLGNTYWEDSCKWEEKEFYNCFINSINNWIEAEWKDTITIPNNILSLKYNWNNIVLIREYTNWAKRVCHLNNYDKEKLVSIFKDFSNWDFTKWTKWLSDFTNCDSMNLLNPKSFKDILNGIMYNQKITNDYFSIFMEEYNKTCKYFKQKEFDLNNIWEISLIDNLPQPNMYWKSTNAMFIKDKNNVYFNCKVIEWVDVESFKVLSVFLVKDKENVYQSDYMHNVVYKSLDIIDSDSFEVIDRFFSKDKNNVYYFNWGLSIAKNIDSKTFKWIADRVWKDKNGC